MLDRIKSALSSWLAPVSAKTDVAVVTAQTPYGDRLRVMGSRSPLEPIMAHAAVSVVMTAADKNATVCAGQRLRLYAPARSGRPQTRGVGRKRVAFLRGDKPTNPGRKAMEFAEAAGDVEEVTAHPVLDLLNRPNPFELGTPFAHARFMHRELSGNSFMRVYRDEQVPEVYNLIPHYCTLVVDPAQGPVRLHYKAPGVPEGAAFAWEDVLHVKHAPSPWDAWWGAGPVHSVLKEAEVYSLLMQTEVARWANMGRPDYVVALAAGATKVERDSAKEAIRRELAGPSKAGRFLVVSNAEVKPLSFPPKDMEYREGLDHLTLQILAAFDIPESEYRMNDANYASSRTGSIQYLRQCIAPRIANDAEALTFGLLPMFGITPGEMWLAYDECVPEDEAAAVTRATSLYGAGLLSANEARAMAGLDPIEDEWADQVRQPTAGAGPMERAAEADDEDDDADSNAAGGAGRPDGDDQGERRVNRNRHACDTCTPGAADRVAKRGGLAWARAAGKHWTGAGVVVKDDRLSASVVDAFARSLERWYSTSLTDALNAAALGQPVDLSQYAPTLEAVLSQYAREFAIEGGAEFGLSPTAAQRWVRGYAGPVSRDISETTAADIRDTIAASQQAGRTLTETIAELKPLIGDEAGWRAERVARTESAYVYGMGELQAAKEAGMTHKRVILSADACPVCEALAEKVNAEGLPIDTPMARVGDTIGEYTVDYRTVDVPPIHPQCRCTVEWSATP